MGFRRQDAGSRGDEIARCPYREVGGQQNGPARSDNVAGRGKEIPEIPLDAEGFSRTSATECGRIENHGVKPVPTLCQASQIGWHILRNKAVRGCGDAVQFEVASTALKGRLRDVHAHGLRSRVRRSDRKSARVGKRIQEARRFSPPQKFPICALVGE